MKQRNPHVNRHEDYNLSITRIGDYELEFYIFTNKPTFPTIYIKHIEEDKYHYLSTFYRFYGDIEDIQEEIIPTIDKVTNGIIKEEILSCEVFSLVIESNRSFLINSYANEKNIEEQKKEAIEDRCAVIDTQILRIISMKWLEFQENLLQKN